MSKSDRPRLKELRAAYRLAGECQELGSDPDAWRLHMLERLRRMVGARVGLYMQIAHPLSEREQVSAPLDAGFMESAQRALWAHYQRENAQRDDPFHLGYFRDFTARLRTRTLESVVDRKVWHRSRHYNDYVRACELDDRITTALRLGTEAEAPLQVMVLHRDAADGPFPRRMARLVHLFHHELGTVLGRRLALPEATDESRALPPRLRQVLWCLLEGHSEKRIADRLGISPHTVNRHVQRLYRRFGVRSRGELVFRCRHLFGRMSESPSARD